MRLGLFMMPLHPSYRAIADCYDRDIDQLVLADKLGFDEAWLVNTSPRNGKTRRRPIC